MIDGYHSVQAAARRAAVRDGGAENRSPPPPIPPSKPEPLDTTHRIGHTVMPTRHEIVCYNCAYAFPHTGRLEKVFCPKCKAQLECGDLLIEGVRTEDCHTVGTVTVAAGSMVAGATLTATRIVIAGDVREARLNPTLAVELETGAQVDLTALVPLALVIRENAAITFDAPLHCRDLDVRGTLCARITSDGILTLHPGSRTCGEIHAAHLVVRDGAALRARIAVRPHTATHADDRPPCNRKPEAPAHDRGRHGRRAEKKARQLELTR